MITMQLLIKGKVQGVFYRATAKKQADRLGLKGWVKNTKKGDVACVVSGSENDVTAFIAWCRKGPTQAVVTDIVVTPTDEKTFNGFSILH